MSFAASVDDDLYSAGQPTPAQLSELAAAGVPTVINLRAPAEPVDYDEAAEAARLGLRYEVLPVAGPEALDRDTVERFAGLLSAARGRGPVLVHCASGNRVGALVALMQGWVQQCDPAQALAVGRSAGLAALEPRVAELLVQA
jgi:uncharacterized protein (TIGR01244 family)